MPSPGWWEKLISSKSTMLLNMIRSSPSLSTHIQAMKIIRRRFTRNITQVKNFRSTLSLNAKKKKKCYLKFRLKIYVKVGPVHSFQSNLEPGIRDAWLKSMTKMFRAFKFYPISKAPAIALVTHNVFRGLHAYLSMSYNLLQGYWRSR